MTPEERDSINERLTKFMGWHHHGRLGSEWIDPHGNAAEKCPDFTADLVAVMEVARTLYHKNAHTNIALHANVLGDCYLTLIDFLGMSLENKTKHLACACYEAIGSQEEV